MRWAAMFLPLVVCVSVVSAEEALAPAEAVKKVDEKVTVEFEVKSAKDALEKAGAVYLDSHEDYKSKENLAVVIPKKVATKLKDGGVTDFVAHFKGKTVRVTGFVTLKDKRPRLEVATPEAITVVEKTP